MFRLAVCCMGVTVTHPLPPLKRGGLSGELQLFGNTGSYLIILNSQFSIQKRGGLSGKAQFVEIPAVIS
jgi:hypothetical protein